MKATTRTVVELTKKEATLLLDATEIIDDIIFVEGDNYFKEKYPNLRAFREEIYTLLDDRNVEVEAD